MQTTREVAVGLFDDAEQAREAIMALKDAGFSRDDISVLMPDREKAGELARETGTNKVGEGAATGLVAGGVLGGLAGWLAGVGAIAIPGVGPFLAAGALGTALAGAAAGGGVGAIAGALVGIGLPDEEAKYYENEVRAGRTLVVVRDKSRVVEAERILREHGAYDVHNPKRDGRGVTERDAIERRRDDRADAGMADTPPTAERVPTAAETREPPARGQHV